MGRVGRLGLGGVETSARAARSFFEAIGDVSALIAKAAARDDDVALARHAARVERAEPFLHIFGRARRGGHVPAQHRLARHLVDVLPAGAGASRELKVDFPQRDSEPLVHNEHFHTPGAFWGWRMAAAVTTRWRIRARSEFESAPHPCAGGNHSPLEGVVENAPLTRGVGGFGGNNASPAPLAIPQLKNQPPCPPLSGG